MPQERNKIETQQPSQTRRRARRKRRGTGAAIGFAVLYVMMVIGVSVLLACVGWICANDVLALNKEERQVTVTITPEDSFSDVVKRLEKDGLIEYRFLFNLYSSFTGSKEKISPGTFTLNTDMDYRALISGMSANSSSRAQITVTIPEGYTVAQIFHLLEEKGVATVDDLNEIAANHNYAFSFLQDIPLGDPNRLEGYLYPDTYDFYTPNNPKYAINKMLVNFDARFTDDMRQKVAAGSYSLHEILTVASLIEKETDGQDRGKIASVIFNRMKNPSYETAGRLEIDATIYYITGRTVTQADRGIQSDYNTFTNQGLPPGPIASPGMESIRAAMNPEKTDYYYYALGDDGLHHFYRSYSGLQDFIKSQKYYSN